MGRAEGSRVRRDSTARRLTLHEEVENELLAMRARRLALESGASEAAYILLAAIAAGFVWPFVSRTQVLLSFLAVVIAVGCRTMLRLHAIRRGADPKAVLTSIRRGVFIVALVWSAGILVLAPHLPSEAFAWVALLFAGVVSGACVSLLPDPTSFYILTTTLLAPLAVTIGVRAQGHFATVGVFLVVVFGGTMVVFYRRSHEGLLSQLRASKGLELTERAEREAREGQDRLVRVLEATTDFVGMAGPPPDLRVRYINQAGRAMLGYTPDEDVTTMTIFGWNPPRLHKDILEKFLPAAIATGVWSGETYLQHRDGREIPVSMVRIIHRTADGEVEGFSAIARDMSDQIAARDTLRVARDAAESANSAKSAFLANTSHEIRTPLNGILGMVELLLDTELTPSQRRSVELIATSGESLLNTINDVLDLSKIEAAQLELENATFDLHNLLHSIARLFAAKAIERDVELVCDVAPEVPQQVRGDAHRLRQVLANLVGNAVKFTERGEVVLTADVARDGASPQLRFSVRDSGIGIPAEHLERIFQPFSQVDTSTTRQYGGTGLGLSIARRLVGLMGGELRVESQVGQGSEFFFEIALPRVAGAVEATAAPSTSILRDVPVLVVDDQPVNRRVTGAALRWGGCDVHVVDSAAAALRELTRAHHAGTPYRLVVSDVQMPGRDGFQLTADVRGDAQLKDTLVMLLSSGTRKGDTARSRELGVAVLLQKPVSRMELLDAAVAALTGVAGERTGSAKRHIIEATRARLRVLLAEDNPINQEVAASMLRKRGHLVEIVANGVEAVDAVRDHGRFDVVLMDLQMPEMDGLRATYEIRNTLKMDVPIVALSANVASEDRERSTAAGMNGFLGKPFKAHELFAVVEHWGRALTPVTAPAIVESKDGGPPPVDLDSFRAMLEDADLAAIGDDMLRLFLRDAPARLAVMRGAVAQSDPRAAASAAHALKSASGNIGAERFSQLLARTERAGIQGDAEALRELVEDVDAEFGRVSRYLNDALSSK